MLKKNENNRIFIFGLGYVGKSISKKLVSLGWKVSGTSKSKVYDDELVKIGITCYQFDVQQCIESIDCNLVNDLLNSNYILSTIPPVFDLTKNNQTDLTTLFCKCIIENPTKEIINNNVVNKELKLKWIGFLSTTGIYGNRNGSLVNEDTEIIENSDVVKKYSAAEKSWQSLINLKTNNLKKNNLKTNNNENCFPIHIFRLSAIYGPNRSALHTISKNIEILNSFEKNKNLLIQRIHIDDVVNILITSMLHPITKKNTSFFEIYNIADDCASSRYEAYEYAAKLLKLNFSTSLSSDIIKGNYSSLSFQNNNYSYNNNYNNQNYSNNNNFRNNNINNNNNNINNNKNKSLIGRISNRGGNKIVDNTKIKKFLIDKTNFTFLYPSFVNGFAAIAKKDFFVDDVHLKNIVEIYNNKSNLMTKLTKK
jgi:nucleoside-diphosphate-sugar epimerase